jgi:hypothetical protein
MNDNVFPEVKIAAKWWADQLRQQPKHDAGDATINAMHVWAMSVHKVSFSEEQITAFENALADAIQTHISNTNKQSTTTWYGLFVDVDYHPDALLDFAARKAGIDIYMRLPIKTTMSIDPGCVKVAAGYRAQFQVIYPVQNS